METPLLEIAQGTPGGAFVDHSAVHLITTATLGAVGLDRAGAVRYRPNIIIETPEGFPPFAENGWVGVTVRLGEVQLRGTMPTPRCAVPTLEHGPLPRSPQAVRHVLEHNRVEVPGFGTVPCAGLYCEVLSGGTISERDDVRIG